MLLFLFICFIMCLYFIICLCFLLFSVNLYYCEGRVYVANGRPGRTGGAGDSAGVVVLLRPRGGCVAGKIPAV